LKPVQSCLSILQSKATVLEALRDTQKGLPDDKMRTFLVFYLFTDNIAASDLEEYETALTAAGCSTAPLRYLKQYGLLLFSWLFFFSTC